MKACSPNENGVVVGLANQTPVLRGRAVQGRPGKGVGLWGSEQIGRRRIKFAKTIRKEEELARFCSLADLGLMKRRKRRGQ